MLNNKKILLCVTGGIAVFKAAALTSKLTQAGAQVKVVMSQSATEFVTPLTFQSLSRNEVYTSTFQENNPKVVAHIDLADWADLVLVAPATANIIGKIANGIADDMISTIMLATTADVFIAPAMNVHMYSHPAVQKNMNTLLDYGYSMIEPAEGYLACGYTGKGRLSEPEHIIQYLENYYAALNADKPLSGKKVLVTAGPTKERIDPVRFITNHSTGKMGYAIAEEAAKMGADVTLVSGEVQLSPPPNVNIIKVRSAQDMYEAVAAQFDKQDLVVKSASVADYRPKLVHDQKMKKKDGDLVIELERTIDILKTLGERKTSQVLVGFAAETENVEEYAKQKLEKKNVDMIVANNVSVKGAGFGSDTNIVTMFKRDGSKIELPILSKHDVAKEILNESAKLLAERRE
ncbi:bifunctional phosphopantothenoylcysteine decarboxylase/phosphopantothenate--cysteine ligase CoaBC [Bacillus sp. AGMB 02131]|uniref:Coenzyme A biosynthesis bifunctional protein CoaBC n=1 Tax=Peribacillus faecalis TaxID=2772559 RepID=A0A927CU70_9BACI|nr:bifunctional phosphopantothenoylcysteine decarboxylase/phosphopantothenate--cysteine ligase CoaBC [Peribacillus faecalis]MBD3106782.1 bifunctional phosphopantothenoylcysteine decarboxylase/phosphopantothenate--cysteine ligase CoaBC [Peribacillus faecalis]